MSDVQCLTRFAILAQLVDGGEELEREVSRVLHLHLGDVHRSTIEPFRLVFVRVYRVRSGGKGVVGRTKGVSVRYTSSSGTTPWWEVFMAGDEAYTFLFPFLQC